MKKILALLSLLIFMVACSSSDTPVKETKGISTSRRTSSSSIGSMGKFKVDSDTYVSLGRNERIQFVVVHYTATNNDILLKNLISNRVSAHFLVLDEDDNIIYNLVPLDQRAWHGWSKVSFRGRTNLNDTSIGIEIVSDGIARDRRNDPNRYPPYDAYLEYKPIQIEKVAQIIKYVAARYNIPAKKHCCSL